MAGMCCGVNIAETESTTTTSSPIEMSSTTDVTRRRRMEIRQFCFVTSDIEARNNKRRHKINDHKQQSDSTSKRLKLDNSTTTVTISLSTPFDQKKKQLVDHQESSNSVSDNLSQSTLMKSDNMVVNLNFPKYGMTSVCGRRRDMEDAVAIRPGFANKNVNNSNGLHFFGVYDGHGCSHVAMKCKERMHEIVKSEVENNGEDVAQWKDMMVRSFSQMDKEVVNFSSGATGAASSSSCRCELQTPQCDAVGSTAVVALVTPDKIVVSNCGDSRAVLCRNGVAVPLSVDHKPDRPDELNRIQEAGGRVIYWDGPRVLGVLAMSRAIGDNYLKPYVISEPEVTITERTSEDECLILASDGLWDVVSNETACGVAKMCLQSRRPPSPEAGLPENDVTVTGAGESSDKACSDASILLTKLALARGSTDNVSVVVVDLRKNL